MIGMLIILIVFGAMLSVLRWWQRNFQPEAELVRKSLHLGMGVFALSFPWLLSALWQAVVLCGLLLALLLALRRVVWLRLRLGAVLGSVARRSDGELYFALGVTALFCLARHSLLLYSLPLLILALADAAAALIGARFGRHRFRLIAGEKSLEGSFAFFMMTMATTFGGLVWIAALTTWQALLMSVVASVFLTLIEALAWRGLDNLFLPLGAYGLLDYLLYCTTEEVLTLLLLTMWLMAAVVIFWKEFRHGSNYSQHRPNAA